MIEVQKLHQTVADRVKHLYKIEDSPERQVRATKMSPPKQIGKSAPGAETPQKRPKPDSSPDKEGVQTDSDTIGLHQLLVSFTEEMKANMNDMNNNINALRNEVTSELASLKIKLESWQEEKKIFEEKQKELESRLDRLERERKRKKVVITGLNKGSGSAKAAVNSMLKESLKSTTEVADAFEIKLRTGQAKIIAEFSTMDDKMAVMREKKSLPDKVFINDDLIAKDQFLQYKAREFVKSLGKEKKVAKIRTGSVQVDEVTYVWEEQAQSFVTRKN